MSLIAFTLIVIYALSLRYAIAFTYFQRKEGMKVKASNNAWSIIIQFISVWLITPFFFATRFINKLKKD